MDWTEAEARLATLERDVTRRQRRARENQALARDGGRVAAAERDPWLGRWLGRWLALATEPAPADGDLRASAPRAA